MKKMLEDLYYGEIQPNLHDYKNNLHFSEAISTIDSSEEKLMALLDGKEKSMLLDLINAYDEITGIIGLNSFIKGFKLGGNIVIETLL